MFFKVLKCNKLKSVPWALVEPHRKQALKNHSQTLERLNERGGLGIIELYCVLKDKEYDYSLKKHDDEKHEAAVPESEDTEVSEGLIGDIQYDETKTGSLYIMGSSLPEPEKALLAKEQQEWIDQRINDIFQAVSGDQLLEKMVEAILNGCEPRPRFLADELGVSRTDINNGQKRLKRHASSLMDGEGV